MDRFSKLHPVGLLLFFAVSIIVPLSFSNPFISVISLFGALFYSAFSGSKKFLKTLSYTMLAIFFVSIFNMLFAHYGEDVLFAVKDTEFTLEALFFGFHQGILLTSSLLWFTALGRSLDSEKLLYLFRFAPKCALIFSMVLGFIPRFLRKLGDIREAQLALNGGERVKGVRAKMQESLNNFSALVSYSLESSIITADSMTARGYNPKAVRAGRYHLVKSDVAIIAAILLLTAVVITQKAIGNLTFIFEPTIYIKRLSIPAVICFAILELIPAAMNFTEEIQWKLSTVKN